jgi:hypothetical protein
VRRLLPLLLLAACAAPRHAGSPKLDLRVCTTSDKIASGLADAASSRFASLAKVEGDGPHAQCSVVVRLRITGPRSVSGWYTKAELEPPCGGKSLGTIAARYPKADLWAEPLADAIYDRLARKPELVRAAAEACPK